MEPGLWLCRGGVIRSPPARRRAASPKLRADVVTPRGAAGPAGDFRYRLLRLIANADPERCVAAFGGDVDAQLALAPGHFKAMWNFPAGIKALTADRFDTSTVTRLL